MTSSTTNLVPVNGSTMEAKGLHHACEEGNVSLVRTMICEHNADCTARDDNNHTPLHVAALHGKEEVVLVLIKEFGCDINIKGQLGKSLLHLACEGGNVSLVRTLISKYKADVNARDDNNDIPLHVAALHGREEVVLALIKEFGCNINIEGRLGRSLLRLACVRGNVSLVRTLIIKYKADVNARNGSSHTPLEVAALNGKKEVVLVLIEEFGCNANIRGRHGRSLLHLACVRGNVSLVRTLISKYKANVTARDDYNNTPLLVAALHGKEEVVLTLIKEFGCDINIKGFRDESLLYKACREGDVSLVKTLCKYKADVNARDDHNDTPLHVAALNGKEEVVLTLIKEFGCDINIKGQLGRSLLHHACHGGHVYLVRTLVHKELMSVLVVDHNGDTPLHICSSRGHADCIEVLLLANAPVLVRNKSGKTPAEIAVSRVKLVYDIYMRYNHHKLQVNYAVIEKHAEKTYPGAHPITRLFAIGHPGAGKSSFVETLKREGFLISFSRVTESIVPPHTAGIVPSVHFSSHYGRVLFYDFAGDPEYYSSHAAILENLSSSTKGDNIFIIFVNMKEEDVAISNALHYWLSFVQNQIFSNVKPKFIIVGSHLDKINGDIINDKESRLDSFCESNREQMEIAFFMCDCCKPRSSQIRDIKKHVISLTAKSLRYELSLNSKILLGLLEKDFSHVTACSVQKIVSHIKDSGIALPQNAAALSSILSELHETGLLLTINDAPKEVILNISKLTNEVHQLLFSKNAVSQLKKPIVQRSLDPSSLDIGVVPESLLLSILPPYITKECLVHLQYCQEIKHSDVGLFPSLPAQSQSNQSLLFFPALCSVDKSASSLSTPPDFTYTMGWLARCEDSHDFFSPRFLHVLLLRMVFRFTLSATCSDSTQQASPEDTDFQRLCKMWKSGVYWLMEEGVECMVELVDTNKGVVVVTKSSENKIHHCVAIFNQIIRCVMEAKDEFCPSIHPRYFLLSSTDPDNYLNRDNMFDVRRVHDVLFSQNRDYVASISGEGLLERSRLEFMRQLTHWHSLFPIDFSSVIPYLRDIVKDTPDLCLHLGFPLSFLHTLEEDYPRSIERRKKELVWKWMSSTSSPPCWWHLAEILKRMNKAAKANEIEKEYGEF